MSENFLTKFAEKNIPLFFSCELTHSCNQKCVHCFQKEREGSELGLDQWKSILDQLRDAGTLHIKFTGGEPMLHPDFWNICEYAKEYHFASCLATNGSLIGREEAQRLRELQIQQVRISLYGATAETHDRVTGVAGSHEKVIRAAELLISQGQEVQYVVPLTRLNFHELDAIWTIMKSHGMDPNISPMIFPSLKGRNNADLRLDNKEMASFYNWIDSKGFSMECFEPQVMIGPLCNAGKLAGAVSPYGDVIPCVSLPLSVGNLLEKSFKQIWWGSPELERIRNTTPEDLECGNCSLNNACVKCMAFGYIDKGKYPYLSPEVCRVGSLSHGGRLYGKAN